VWYLYLDESGDLGFDFSKQGTSKYFTICIVATSHVETNNKFRIAVKTTLRNKINIKRNSKRLENELKGSDMCLAYKKYTWSKIKDSTFLIYSITINKEGVNQPLKENKDKLYNYIAKLVVNSLPLELASDTIEFIIDKSKNKKERQDFNTYLSKVIKAKLLKDVSINITHISSETSPGLQMADIFCNGIYSMYQHKNKEWYKCFQEKIKFEQLYFNKKNSEP